MRIILCPYTHCPPIDQKNQINHKMNGREKFSHTFFYYFNKRLQNRANRSSSSIKFGSREINVRQHRQLYLLIDHKLFFVPFVIHQYEIK